MIRMSPQRDIREVLAGLAVNIANLPELVRSGRLAIAVKQTLRCPDNHSDGDAYETSTRGRRIQRQSRRRARLLG